MRNKVVLFGSSGHLGSYVKESLSGLSSINLYCPSRNDVQKILTGKADLKKYENSYLINLVSIVGKELISKESNSNIELINSYFPLRLAEICEITDSMLIHISSNSIFENSPERFRNINTKLDSNTVYGLSKIKAEINIQSILNDKNFNIVRTPQHYSINLTNKRNLFYGIYNKLKIDKKIIIDRKEIFSIASCKQISNFILKIIKNNYVGIHHVCEQFEYTWLDIAISLCNVMKLDVSKSIKVEIDSKIIKNSTIFPSYEGLLKSDLNDFFSLINYE